MNLSGLTPRQWAYVLHRIECPDAEPLDHPGNPRKQNLDRIADQLGEQLDRDELQALRDLVAGKQPQSSVYDEESGRDLDAELLDRDASDEPLDDRGRDGVHVSRPVNRLAAGARSPTAAAGAAPVRPHVAGVSESDPVPEGERTPDPGGCDAAPAQPRRAADRRMGQKRTAAASRERHQTPASPVADSLRAASSEPVPNAPQPALQPRLF